MEKKLLKKVMPETSLSSVVRTADRQAGQLERLIRELATSKTYHSSTTHQIRILTRKCAMALKVLRYFEVDVSVKSKDLRDLRRSLGKLRDADIRLEGFQSFVSGRKSGANDSILGALQFEWHNEHAKAKKEILEFRSSYEDTLKTIRKKLKQVLPQISGHRWKKRDDRWMKKQLDNWSDFVDSKFQNEKQLHALRIDTKHLRYLLQCLLPDKSPAPLQSWLDLLGDLQTDLGERRDLRNIIEWLEDLEKGLSIRDTKSKLTASIHSWKKFCVKKIRQLDPRVPKLRVKLLSQRKYL